MQHGDQLRHWQQLAEGYIESAATLYRKQKYAHMLHHCYFAVQSALEATLVARRVTQMPSTISLVAKAQALGDRWSDRERELLVELTEWYRSGDGNDLPAGGAFISKDDCLRTLMASAELVRGLSTEAH